MSADPDVIVVGAGIAGLSAALALSRAGLGVLVLEARSRLGGRIFTQCDEKLSAPVELGAEFIHGKPPQVWNLARHLGIKPTEVAGENWCSIEGQLRSCEFFEQVDEVLGKIDKGAPDESFLSFLERCCPDHDEMAKRWATGYISGFHGADPARISVHSVASASKADEEIEAERAFRLPQGYQTLIKHFADSLASAQVEISLDTVVQKVSWNRGRVHVTAQASNQRVEYRTSRALITLPIPVLQANKTSEPGSVCFVPALPSPKQNALAKLAMGKAVRLVLRFRTRFWDDLRALPSSKSLASLRFLFSLEEWFPTWWTTLPDKLPLLVAWAPFQEAERLSGQSQAFVAERALRALAHLFGVDFHELESLMEKCYWHDWEQDPFSRGAYSYVMVGGDSAQRDLGAPVEGTLFFAGEATDVTGHNGTVHGALASADRVVREILAVTK